MIHDTRVQTVASVVRKMPRVKPIKVKRLLERRTVTKPVEIKKEKDSSPEPEPAPKRIETRSNPTINNQHHLQQPKPPKPPHSAQSKAYFCRKCYKVFFKLGEFNEHVNNCDSQPVLNGTVNGNGDLADDSYANSSAPPVSASTPKSSSESEYYTSSGRPLRNCVKEVSYIDEVYEAGRTSGTNSPVLAFECNYCNCTFPSFQSRNSHMRIHKGKLASNGEARTNNLSKRAMTNSISSLYPQVTILFFF